MSLRKVGRALFGGYFIYSGINHFLHEKDLVQYAKAKHVPAPDAAVIASGIALVAGGTSLALGLKPKFGAASVVGFLAAVTPSIHNFWADADPNQRQNNMAHFGKNLALLSGALAFAGGESRHSD
jgi:putative oxidoreductase